MLINLNMKVNVKIPCIPEGMHEVLAVEGIHILVDSTHFSLVANLIGELSLEVLLHLLIMVGTPLMVKCSICESINHWAQGCPDKIKDAHDTYYSYHVVTVPVRF